MNKRFYVKPNLAEELIKEYLAKGGAVKVVTKGKTKAIKTFLNHSNRGAKARTLRNSGYAKGVA